MQVGQEEEQVRRFGELESDRLGLWVTPENVIQPGFLLSSVSKGRECVCIDCIACRTLCLKISEHHTDPPEMEEKNNWPGLPSPETEPRDGSFKARSSIA